MEQGKIVGGTNERAAFSNLLLAYFASVPPENFLKKSFHLADHSEGLNPNPILTLPSILVDGTDLLSPVRNSGGKRSHGLPSKVVPQKVAWFS